MIYRLLGSGYRKRLAEWILYSGHKFRPGTFSNYSFAFALCLGVLSGLAAGQLFLPVAAGVFIGAFALMHGMLVLSVERRARFVEGILPDALLLMAANSRAGYIPSKALLLSARKEFGPLSDAIKDVGKELTTGESLEESLRKINSRIRSDILDRTVKLLNEGIRLGGHFASLLEENASDIRRIQAIKNDMKANIAMYSIFITFAGCIGAPALYALSGFLIGTINKLGGSIEVPDTSSLSIPFMKLGGLDVSPDFLFLFSIVSIIATTIAGSVIVGLISSGREKDGIKYAPIFLAMGLIVFFAARFVIGGMFSSLGV